MASRNHQGPVRWVQGRDRIPSQELRSFTEQLFTQWWQSRGTTFSLVKRTQTPEIWRMSMFPLMKGSYFKTKTSPPPLCYQSHQLPPRVSLLPLCPTNLSLLFWKLISFTKKQGRSRCTHPPRFLKLPVWGCLPLVRGDDWNEVLLMNKTFFFFFCKSKAFACVVHKISEEEA